MSMPKKTEEQKKADELAFENEVKEASALSLDDLQRERNVLRKELEPFTAKNRRLRVVNSAIAERQSSLA